MHASLPSTSSTRTMQLVLALRVDIGYDDAPVRAGELRRIGGHGPVLWREIMGSPAVSGRSGHRGPARTLLVLAALDVVRDARDVVEAVVGEAGAADSDELRALSTWPYLQHVELPWP